MEDNIFDDDEEEDGKIILVTHTELDYSNLSAPLKASKLKITE